MVNAFAKRKNETGRNNRENSGKPAFFLLLLALIFVVFAATACGDTEPTATASPTPEEDVYFNIVLEVDSTAYEVLDGSTKKVKRGDDARFSLKMKGDNKIADISRAGGQVDYETIDEPDGTVTVVIKSIRYSFFADVECDSSACHISYYPNGGTYLDGSDPQLPYTVGYSFENRFRPNTETGNDRFSREGYVLTGWNTKEDGSGEHTGLGSRVTVARGETLKLYAEWAKESDASSFEYRKYGKGWTITGYKGESDLVVIPSKIEESPVDTIAKGAFADNTTVDTIVFPSSLEVIADGAFTGSSIEEIYLYDNIEYISDKSFEGCSDLKTVRINAIEKPRYSKNLYSEYNFADKYDILILNKDKKKIVVFGGSGAYFSVDAKLMEETLAEAGEDYICINMAVNGWFNGVAQFEMIESYLKEGDVFLHVPEPSSGYSLMYDTTMTPFGPGFEYNRLRLYYCVESNYDLLSLVDLSTVTDFFDGFNAFNEGRAELDEMEYTDFKTKINWYGVWTENALGYIDDRGGFALPKKAGMNKDTGEADLVVEFVVDKTANDRLNGFYNRFKAKGIKVCFTTAPVNRDTLVERLVGGEKFDRASADGVLFYGRMPGIPKPAFPDLETWIRVYGSAVEEHLDCTVILPISETLYTTGDYFEPDYHLADEVDSEYTLKITNALKKELQ